jgi:hypothetical protein
MSNVEMDFWLIAYIVICVVVGGMFVSNLYKRNQSVAAMTCIVLLILIFTFYGLRWFKGGALKGSTPDPKAPWPPIVNMCPDFLVGWTDPNTKYVYCYDAANVYGLKTASDQTPFFTGQKLTINGVSGQSAFLIKNPDANKNATNLKMDTDGKRWPLLNAFLRDTRSITQITNGPSIRWEGVWDGSSATADAAPLP